MKEKAQGLVELALVAPILLLFIIGVFEVGWALRNYLVLVNATREVARFAVRPGYMDFSDPNNVVGYDAVYQHLHTTLNLSPNSTGELGLDFNKNTTLIISHLVADTQQPCVDVNNCDCTWFEDPDFKTLYAAHILTLDDLNFHPATPNKGYHARTYGITQTTRINYDETLHKMEMNANRYNCNIMKTSQLHGVYRTYPVTSMIVVEVFYDQPQLFGLFGKYPIPMYAHTSMRMIARTR